MRVGGWGGGGGGGTQVIHILFAEKVGHIYLAALKKGAIRHAHPHYAVYKFNFLYMA